MVGCRGFHGGRLEDGQAPVLGCPRILRLDDMPMRP